MPVGLSTGDAMKEDGEGFKQNCAAGVGCVAGKVEEAACSVRESMEPEPEPTLFEKAKEKVCSAYDSAKKATVG